MRPLNFFRRSNRKLNKQPLTPLGELIKRKLWRRALEFIEDESNLEKLHRYELHYCLERKAPLSIICALIYAKEDIICTRNELNRFPIHTAMEYNPDEDIVELLVNSHREALIELDTKGRNPLHIGCQAGTINPKILDILCNAEPSILAMEDDDGATPMEICITRCNNEDDKCRCRPISDETLKMIHSFTGVYLKHRRKNAGEMYRQVTRRKSMQSSSSSACTAEESVSTPRY
jgi:hypothetical protein